MNMYVTVVVVVTLWLKILILFTINIVIILFIKDVYDNSGIRLYVTPNLRPIEFGVLTVSINNTLGIKIINNSYLNFNF